MSLFLQLLINGLVNGCAFALVALGFALICNTTRIFHFAHGGIYALSGYMFYTLYTQHGVPIWGAIPLTLGFSAVIGIFIDLLVYRPLDRQGASTTMHMISSLGLYIIIVNVICMSYGNNSKILVSGQLPTVEFCDVSSWAPYEMKGNAVQFTENKATLDLSNYPVDFYIRVITTVDDGKNAMVSRISVPTIIARNDDLSEVELVWAAYPNPSDDLTVTYVVEFTEFVGSLMLNVVQIATAVTFVVIFLGFLTLLKFTSLGIKLRAMRDNQTLLSLYGINPNNIRLFVFGAGSALCALAAILVGLDVGIDPHVGMNAVVTAAVALIAGGIGIFEGAAFGALMLGCLQSIAVWQMSARWQDMVTFIVLILFLLFRPQGIMGQRGRLEEGADL